MARSRSLCWLVLALAPAAALAQPAPSAPPPPNPYPPQQPAPAPPPPNPYPPQQPQPYPQQPQQYPPQQPQPQPQQPQQYPPQQGYPQQGYPQQQYPQQQYPQPYQQPAQSLRNGMTFEANIGLGYLSSDGSDSEGGVAFGIGVGGWISPKTAVSVRLSSVTLSDPGIRLTGGFIGPSAQYWFNDNFWLGGGAGLSVLAVSSDFGDDSTSGFGVDLRAGYTFSTSTENTLNVSLELTPGFYDDGDFTGVGVLFGYQHL